MIIKEGSRGSGDRLIGDPSPDVPPPSPRFSSSVSCCFFPSSRCILRLPWEKRVFASAIQVHATRPAAFGCSCTLFGRLYKNFDLKEGIWLFGDSVVIVIIFIIIDRSCSSGDSS